MGHSLKLPSGRGTMTLLARRVFVVTVLILPLVAIVPSFVPPITVASVKHDGLDYDARFPTSPAFQSQLFSESRTSALQSIQFHIPFIAFEVRPYSDLLQSAALNDGVRVELDKAGTLAVVIASAGTPGYTSYILKSGVTTGEWHVLDLSITRDFRLRAVLDNVTTVDTINPDFLYKITSVAVGRGFSSDRTFDGRVRDASFSYSLADPRPQPPSSIIQGVELACLILNFIAIFVMSDNLLPENAGIDEPRSTWS